MNHTTASVDLRERLYISPCAVAGVLRACRAHPGVAEAVALSTCNRTELYAVADDADALDDVLATHAELSRAELAPHLYRAEDAAAAAHLFRVAAGLDSLVLGETQVLGQLADALATAQAHGAAGRILSVLFQHAVATGKRVRAETAISDGAFSVGRVAVEFARSLFGDLAGRPVLVLGAGKMSEITARHISTGGAHPIFVANRTHAHAEELAARLDGRALAYDAIEAALVDVDILISSTSAPHIVLHADLIARAMARRAGRPLCLIDIAIPRDIDPEAASLPGVHLYNIDDLQAVTAACCDQRADALPGAEAIVAAEVERWRRRQAGLQVAPIIAALHDAFEHARRDELAQAALTGFTPDQQQVVEALTTSLVKRLLHTPTVRLKDAVTRDAGDAPATLLSDLFDLEARE